MVKLLGSWVLLCKVKLFVELLLLFFNKFCIVVKLDIWILIWLFWVKVVNLGLLILIILLFFVYLIVYLLLLCLIWFLLIFLILLLVKGKLILLICSLLLGKFWLKIIFWLLIKVVKVVWKEILLLFI